MNLRRTALNEQPTPPGPDRRRVGSRSGENEPARTSPIAPTPGYERSLQMPACARARVPETVEDGLAGLQPAFVAGAHVRVVQPPDRQALGQVSEAATSLGEPQPHQPVVAERPHVLERRGAQHVATSHHGGRGQDHGGARETLKRELGLPVGDVVGLTGAVALLDAIGEREIEAPDVVNLALELARLPEVVVVEEGDELATRHFDAPIARSGFSGVVLSNMTDGTAERGDDVRCRVGRPVVNNDHLVRRARLCENGFHRLGKTLGTVIDRDDDADCGRHCTKATRFDSAGGRNK